MLRAAGPASSTWTGAAGTLRAPTSRMVIFREVDSRPERAVQRMV